MKSSFKYISRIFAFVAMMLIISSCGNSNKTIGNSTDTTSVTKAGGPPIADTATVSAREKAAKTDSGKAASTAKGNADPKGYTKQ